MRIKIIWVGVCLVLSTFFAWRFPVIWKMVAQDEVVNPRQVLARPTSVATVCVATEVNGPKSGKNFGRAFRLANNNFSLFGRAATQLWSAQSGQNPNFGLFGWPIPTFWSVRSGQYPIFDLIGLANTHTLVYLFLPRTTIRSVWSDRYPRWSVRSGHYPQYGLFSLDNTYFLVCSVWQLPAIRSLWTGQNPKFGLFGLVNTRYLIWSRLANTHSLVCLASPIPTFGLFAMVKTDNLFYLVWSILLILACLVWPIPNFWSVLSGHYAQFGLFSLVNTRFLI